MAMVDAISRDVPNNNELSTAKRKRPSDDDSTSRLTNGTTTVITGTALQSLQNILQDLVQVLQEFDISSSVLNLEIAAISSKDHTPKRAKIASTPRTTTILSQVKTQSYTNVDNFVKDIQTAVRLIQDRSESSSEITKAKRLEEEVVAILNNEIASGTIPIPRADGNDALLLSSHGERGSLETDPNVVLTTPGFVYGLSQTSKRLYSSFRLSSTNSENRLQALPLDKLPNNITTTSVKAEKAGNTSEKSVILKDLFNQSKSVRLEPPRHSSSSTKGSSVTWGNSEEQKRSHRSRDKQIPHDQQLTTGQWLSYNIPPLVAEMPFAEARRKRRDRALSTGEANIDLTEQEKESIRKSQQNYQHAKSDSLFKSLYSSFAPTHDNSGAIVPKEVRSRYWWTRHGAAKYLSSSTTQMHTPFDDENEVQDDETSKEVPLADDSRFNEMLETWIDPELTGLPKEHSDMDKDIEEVLADVSDMLQTLSSYQRNRTLTLDSRHQGSTTQNRSVVELSGDNSTPSSSEWLLYDTLKESLTSLIASLPPYAVAKLDGEQLGNLNISTKLLVHNPKINGTTTTPESQAPSTQPVTRTQPVAPIRAQPPPQVSTPTHSVSQSTGNRPPAGLYSKYRAMPVPPSYQNHGGQVTINPRASFGPQTPSTPVGPLRNGTRPSVNGYNSYNPQTSPQRPSSSSSSRPAMNMTGQTYSTYNINANATPTGRSASPQNLSGLNTVQGQRANWNLSNGTIGSMFSAEEVTRLEERQKAQMAAQAAQIRQDSSTPRPTSQAMSPISNGTPGA